MLVRTYFGNFLALGLIWSEHFRSNFRFRPDGESEHNETYMGRSDDSPNMMCTSCDSYSQTEGPGIAYRLGLLNIFSLTFQKIISTKNGMRKNGLVLEKIYSVSGEVPAFIETARSSHYAVVTQARKKGRSGLADTNGMDGV